MDMERGGPAPALPAPGQVEPDIPDQAVPLPPAPVQDQAAPAVIDQAGPVNQLPDPALAQPQVLPQAPRVDQVHASHPLLPHVPVPGEYSTALTQALTVTAATRTEFQPGRGTRGHHGCIPRQKDLFPQGPIPAPIPPPCAPLCWLDESRDPPVHVPWKPCMYDPYHGGTGCSIIKRPAPKPGVQPRPPSLLQHFQADRTQVPMGRQYYPGQDHRTQRRWLLRQMAAAYGPPHRAYNEDAGDKTQLLKAAVSVNRDQLEGPMREGYARRPIDKPLVARARCCYRLDTDLHAFMSSTAQEPELQVYMPETQPDIVPALRKIHELVQQCCSVTLTTPPDLHRARWARPWFKQAQLLGEANQHRLWRFHKHMPLFGAHRVTSTSTSRLHISTNTVRVGGATTIALFDTGATCCVMSKSFQEYLDLQLKPTAETISGVGGKAKVLGLVETTVKIGPVQHVVLFNVLEQPATAYDVILGESYLTVSEFSIQYKSDRATLTVHTPAHAPVRRECSWSVPLRASLPASIVETDRHELGFSVLTYSPEEETGGEDVDVSVVSTKSQWRQLKREIHKQGLVAYRVVVEKEPAVEKSSAPNTSLAHLHPDIRAVVDKYKAAGTLSGDVPPGQTAKATPMQIHIQPNVRPAYTRQYRLTPEEHGVLMEKVQDFIRRGWIEPSNSPWSSSVLFVPKPHGRGLRFCVDFRMLNKLTVKDKNPLPPIAELLDSMEGGKVFSSLDLLSGFYQIPLHENSRDCTAFPTPLGQYRWTVMPMGLCNSPAVFQQAMNHVLRGPIIKGFCKVYVDDVLIMSKTPQQHAEHLEQVLSALSNDNFYCQLPKCQFGLSELLYLGFVVDGDGVRPDPAKVKAVATWNPPEKELAVLTSAGVSAAAKATSQKRVITEVKRFMGFMQFFARFIPRFAHVAAPLYAQMRDKPPPWTQACTDAWRDMCKCLANATQMHHPDVTRPFHVYTDASVFGIGGVVMQCHQGEMRPVAFCARKLTDPETRYTTTEQELLAVVYCFKQWRCYLQGPTVLLHTDHEPLTWFQTQPKLSRRQARWAEFMAQFQYTWLYVAGDRNIVADALSRRIELPNDPDAGNLPTDTIYASHRLHAKAHKVIACRPAGLVMAVTEWVLGRVPAEHGFDAKHSWKALSANTRQQLGTPTVYQPGDVCASLEAYETHDSVHDVPIGGGAVCGGVPRVLLGHHPYGGGQDPRWNPTQRSGAISC